jgi:GT2 family glycosyltransferase
VDADDTVPPDKLERQVAHLRAHPEIGCVLGRQRIVLEAGVELPLWAYLSPEMARKHPDIAEYGHVPHMSMVVRASLFEEVGVFDAGYVHGEDADWLMRARERAPIATLNDVVLHRRIHGANLSNDLQALRTGTFRVLRDHARRMRAKE